MEFVPGGDSLRKILCAFRLYSLVLRLVGWVTIGAVLGKYSPFLVYLALVS